MGAKNSKSLLISITKCIELNSELILVWVWAHTRDPDPIYTFFWGKSLVTAYNKKSAPTLKFILRAHSSDFIKRFVYQIVAKLLSTRRNIYTYQGFKSYKFYLP